MKEKTYKINFFKALYISIFKTKRYDELLKLKLRKSIKYITTLIFILGIIYSGVLTYKMKKNANDLKEYLQTGLPEMKYVEKTLQVEQSNRVVLDNEMVKVNFGGQIVIDTLTDYNELVEEYVNKKQGTILLTTNKFTTIEPNGRFTENSYDEIIAKFLGQEPNTLDKETLIYLFDNIPYRYYFIIYLLSYVIAYLLILFIYNLVMSLVAYIVCKIKKISINFKEIYTLGLYALTWTAISYFVLGFFSIRNIYVYIQAIIALITAVYLGSAIYYSKKDN